MNIAICDDSELDAITARNVIKQTAAEMRVKTDISYYLSAEEIENKLLRLKEPLDILILDIDMPKVSGLQLAEKLRSNNLNLIIIFLSNHEEFVFKAIEFQPFRYIRKIKMTLEMPLAIKAAVKLIDLQVDSQVVVNTEDGEIKIMISEILYIEADRRKTMIHLINEKNVLANISISELYLQINSSKFVMIHRSCGVNADYVQSVNNDVAVMKNGEKLVISRRRAKDVKQRMAEEWGKSI